MQTNETTSNDFTALLDGVLNIAFGTAYRLTGNREEAEDLLQEAAVQAFRSFHTFQAGTNFKAWFFKIMLNCFRYNYRSKKHKPETTVLEELDSIYLYIKTEEAGLHAEREDPAGYVLSKMTEEQIQEAMNALSEEYRVVSVLYFMEECTYQEIADLLECPVGTVRSRLHRGRKLLQKALWRLVEEHSILGEGGA